MKVVIGVFLLQSKLHWYYFGQVDQQKRKGKMIAPTTKDSTIVSLNDKPGMFF